MAVVANYAATLGEHVGRLFEEAVVRRVVPVVEELGYTAVPEKMKNGSNNKYQIDLVVRDKEGHPVILIESKYIRYKKHNRDKGSWLCTAHHNLKRTHPSIRKLTAILAGNWSEPSLAMLRSFGVDPIRVEFATFTSVLGKHGIKFDWAETDKETPRKSWEKFELLTADQKQKIGDELVSEIMEKVKNDIQNILGADMPPERRVSNVEVVLRTDLNESIVYDFPSVPEAIKQLVTLTSERLVSDEDVKKSRPPA